MISLTAIITHGLIIPRLGYYYDDWYMLWSGASRGVDSLIPLFSMDRPFMGVIYSGYYRLIGQNILGWHLFALLYRILSGIAFYWILSMVWPKLKSLFVLSAMLFVVFPGFLAEPNAATKINQLLGYTAALFSIAFSIQSFKTNHRLWKFTCVIISMLLTALYLWLYEYMIGLEVMRLTLLYWMQWQGKRDALLAAAKKVVLAYIPSVFIMGLFLFWRVLIFESTRNATDLKGLVTGYRTSFLIMGLRLVFQAISDFFSASLFPWFLQGYHLLASANYQQILIALAVAAGVLTVAGGFIYLTRNLERAGSEEPSPFVLVLTGALITLGAVFPVVLSNRHIDLMDPYKAYALHPSAGAMIIVTGLAAMLKPRFRNTALIVLLGLAVVTQSLNNQYWADFWETQRNVWWQLTWRAPDIRDDTLVMAYLPSGYSYQQDYEIWGPLNMIYRPGPQHYPPIQSEVLNPDTLLNIGLGSVTDPHDRDIFIPRDFKNLLLISQPDSASCLHVIDGAMPAYSTSERLIVEKAGSYSKIDRIIASAAIKVPPKAVFGNEPAHGWCYDYQQAALARQTGDWKRIGNLYDITVSAGLKPADPSEYIVFIEGLVNLGRLNDASKIVNDAIKGNDTLKYSFCQSLASAPVYPTAFGYQRYQINKLVCK